MDRSVKKIGLINWVALLAATAAMLLISSYVKSLAGLMGTILTGFGLLVALLSFAQMSLEGREQLEKMELEEMSKDRGGESLFAASGDDTFPARRSREQFERYFIPGLTVILFLLQAAAAIFFWEYAPRAPGVVQSKVPLALGLFALLGLILFIFGKYSSNVARLQKQRLVRPGAAYLLLSAYSCAMVCVTLGLVYLNLARADFIVGRALSVVVGLVALETFAGLLLEIYRVRLKGKDSHLLYDSRLVGLLGQPEALITTAAHALDYQFGFKVSETWFYRFLEKALAWMVLAQLGLLVLSSCIAVVEPGELALLERGGKPVAGRSVIGPGLHFKLPWPIDKVYRYRTEQIQSFIVGAEPESGQTIQWKVPHAKEDNFLVANRSTNFVSDTNAAAGATNQGAQSSAPPVSLLSVSIPVQFQVTNLVEWAYLNQNPTNLLEMLSRREVARFLASAEMEKLMSSGRGQAAEALAQTIQDAANARQLGVKITFVGLEDVHPPQKVAADYETIVTEREKREMLILDAQTHAIVTNAAALAGRNQKINGALADRDNAITNAFARSNLFNRQLQAYAAAPGEDGVYERQAYLNVLTRVAGTAQKKFINASGNTNYIFEFNEEPKIRDLGNSLVIPNK